MGSAYQGYGKQRNLYQALPTLHELPTVGSAYQGYGKERNLWKTLPTLHELLPFACMPIALRVALYLQAIQ
ncbi:MAG: hypothetical protein F6K65_13230 [Moorea sp. SIO3C2]|nr:hypothetical protein [Moorena sp. SIO3C2]